MRHIKLKHEDLPRSAAYQQAGLRHTEDGHKETGPPSGEPRFRTLSTPLPTIPDGVESTQPPRPSTEAPTWSRTADGLLPNDPAYLPHALLRFAPQMDRIGLPQEEREPFLRDLSALVASALDALYPASVAEPVPCGEVDGDGETVP